MLLNWKTFSVLYIVIQTGILFDVPAASSELLEVAESIEQDPIFLSGQWNGESPAAVVEERGIIRDAYNKMKKKWKGFVEKAKDVLEKVVVFFMYHKRGNRTCYDNLGCFYIENNMSLQLGGPQAPEKLDTTFYFFKKGSPYLNDLLNENLTKVLYPNMTYTVNNWTMNSTMDILDTRIPLMVVTHGLTGSKRTPWMLPLVTALLDNVNCTVLVVDWEKGAAGTYPDAGVNTPMAGALISFFLQKIVNETNEAIGPKNITLVGFSMGAQVMGFTGRHFRNQTNKTLWRIAGLDPAGWLYENTNATLTKYDADYVDVIHTNGGSIKDFRIGLGQSVGHVDFYPNGGTVQTGCKEKPKTIPTDYMDVITCSHYKATSLFIESLTNRNCSFVTYGCKSWDEFKSGNCTRRVPFNETGLLGFYSNTRHGRGNQYLYTNAKSPFCRGNNTDPPNWTHTSASG